MPHYQFPTNYVYWETLKEHDYLKNKYTQIIDRLENNPYNKLNTPFNNCDVKYTSFGKNQKFLCNDDIDTIIWKPIDNFINEINSNYKCKISLKGISVLHNYWFNTYELNDFQEFHDHHGSREVINNEYCYPIFSGIYILNDDTESSSIVFKTPNTIPVPFSDLTNPHSFYTSKESDIKEGSVVIFPSQLEHMVTKCVKPGRRTIAFNIYSQL
jgi:hypothetical protein